MTQTELFIAPARTLGQMLVAPFKAVGHFLIVLAESGPRIAQINRLNATSDEQLAAQGKTREGEVRRIFGASLYL